MNFSELTDKQKVEKVKQNYIDIIIEIKAKPEELEKYIPISSATSDGDKASREAVVAKIKNLKIDEECKCSECYDIDVDQISDEFEVFVDFARIRAEAASY